jgi:hypothetical protein
MTGSGQESEVSWHATVACLAREPLSVVRVWCPAVCSKLCGVAAAHVLLVCPWCPPLTSKPNHLKAHSPQPPLPSIAAHTYTHLKTYPPHTCPPIRCYTGRGLHPPA